MTWIEVDGFEVYGDDSTPGSDLVTSLDYRYDDGSSNAGVGGSLASSLSLVDNDLVDGTFALELPTTGVGQSVQVAIPTDSAHNMAPASVGTLVHGFRWFYDEDFTGNKRIMRFLTGTLGGVAGTSTAGLSIVDDGSLLWQDGTGTSSSVTGILTDQEWHYIEVKVLFDNTGGGPTGTVQVYVDGTSVISLTGRAMYASFLKHWGIRIEQEQFVPAQRIDDLVIYSIDGVNHTDVIGDRRIVPMVPATDATPNDFTPSTGSDNFDMIDEVELDEADYVDGTNGDDDHYDTTSVTAVIVDCLQIDVVCIATSGTPTLHVGFDNGTADEADDGVIGTGSNSVVRKLFAKDPDGTDWTQSSANSIKATQRVTE